jgi:CHAT domain-containing protein
MWLRRASMDKIGPDILQQLHREKTKLEARMDAAATPEKKRAISDYLEIIHREIEKYKKFEDDYQPFADNFYWGAFTISGNPQ